MDKKEITTLFRQYYGRMYGMAVSILYDEQESKDVVSDIFERLLVADTLLLPDTVEHYLLTSVRNSCLKRIAQKSNVKVEYRNPSAAHVRFYLQWDSKDTLQDIIDKLNHFEKVHVSFDEANQLLIVE